MDLTNDQLESLAGFLARRLRPDLTPYDPIDAPVRGATLQAEWARQLRRARLTHSVPRLIRAAARALPDDPALREASALAATSRAAARETWLMLTSTALALLTTALGSLAATVALASAAWSSSSPM